MIIHQTVNSLGNYNYNAYFYTGTGYNSHFHSNYELIYVEKGVADIIVGSETVHLEAHEFLLISPYTIHSFLIDEMTRVWVGVFSKDYISAFAKKYDRTRFSKFFCCEPCENFLKTTLLSEQKPDLYTAKASLYAVCSECLKNAKRYEIEVSSDFLSNVVNYVMENLTDEISMKTIADMIGYEYHYFSELFHRCFSINFCEFVNINRFVLSCELLLDETASITEICARCGFKTIRNFNRVFKKLSGKTPAEYRKEH